MGFAIDSLLVFLLFFSNSAHGAKLDELFSFFSRPKLTSPSQKFADRMKRAGVSLADISKIPSSDRKALQKYISNPSRALVDLEWFRFEIGKSGVHGKVYRAFLFGSLDENSLKQTADLTEDLFRAAEANSSVFKIGPIEHSSKVVWRDFFDALGMAIGEKTFSGSPHNLLAAMATRVANSNLPQISKEGVEFGVPMLRETFDAIAFEFRVALRGTPDEFVQGVYGSPMFNLPYGHRIAILLSDTINDDVLKNFNIFKRWIVDSNQEALRMDAPEAFDSLLATKIQDPEVMTNAQKMAEQDLQMGVLFGEAFDIYNETVRLPISETLH